MFERYTEKARRVVFFARYEASNYGRRRSTRSICCWESCARLPMSERCFLRSFAAIEWSYTRKPFS